MSYEETEVFIKAICYLNRVLKAVIIELSANNPLLLLHFY